MNKEKALKNQGLEFREDIFTGGGWRARQGSRSLNQSLDSDIRDDSNRRVMYSSKS